MKRTKEIVEMQRAVFAGARRRDHANTSTSIGTQLLVLVLAFENSNPKVVVSTVKQISEIGLTQKLWISSTSQNPSSKLKPKTPSN